MPLRRSGSGGPPVAPRCGRSVAPQRAKQQPGRKSDQERGREGAEGGGTDAAEKERGAEREGAMRRGWRVSAQAQTGSPSLPTAPPALPPSLSLLSPCLIVSLPLSLRSSRGVCSLSGEWGGTICSLFPYVRRGWAGAGEGTWCPVMHCT